MLKLCSNWRYGHTAGACVSGVFFCFLCFKRCVHAPLQVPNAATVLTDLESIFSQCVANRVHGASAATNATHAQLQAMQFAVFASARRFVSDERRPSAPLRSAAPTCERFDAKLEARVRRLAAGVAAADDGDVVEEEVAADGALDEKAAILGQELKDVAALYDAQCAALGTQVATSSDTLRVAEKML